MVHEKTPKDELPTWLEWQIGNYEIIFLQSMTPLLRQELHHAIRMHREAIDVIKLQRDHQYLEELDIEQKRIQVHWNKIFGDLVSRVRLMRNIGKFQSFVVGKLLEDYTRKPYTIKLFEVEQAFLVEWHDAAAKGGSQNIEGDESDERTVSYGYNNSASSHSGNDRTGSDHNEILLEAYNMTLCIHCRN